MGVEATCVKLGLSDGAGGVEGGTRCGSSGENDEGHPGSRASLNWRRWRDLGQRALDSIQGRRRGGGVALSGLVFGVALGVEGRRVLLPDFAWRQGPDRFVGKQGRRACLQEGL